VRKNKICPYYIERYNCNACLYKDNCRDDVLCYKFEPNKIIAKKASEIHPLETSLSEILINLMGVEKATEDAIIKFMQSLESNGIKAILLSTRLRSYIDNLIALQTLDTLIKQYGLSDFRKQILEKEIERIFNPYRKSKKSPGNE